MAVVAHTLLCLLLLPLLLVLLLPAHAIVLTKPVSLRKVNCFDSKDQRVLSGIIKTIANMTPLACAHFCVTDGRDFLYAGVADGKTCLCGDTIDQSTTDDRGCQVPCAVNQSEACGGKEKTDVYMLREGCPLIKHTIISPRPVFKSNCLLKKAYADRHQCLFAAHLGSQGEGNIVNLRQTTDEDGFICDIRVCKSVVDKADLKAVFLDDPNNGNSMYIRGCDKMKGKKFAHYFPPGRSFISAVFKTPSGNATAVNISTLTPMQHGRYRARRNEFIKQVVVTVGGSLLLMGCFAFCCHSRDDENVEGGGVRQPDQQPLLSGQVSAPAKQLPTTVTPLTVNVQH